MRSLDLNGEWTLLQKDRNFRIPAVVPGQVQLDLLRAGLIEDPHYRDREETLDWIGHTVWDYTREVNLDEACLSKQKIALVCEGLDTVADVYVNDQGVGRPRNQFRGYAFSIKPYLKPGQNTLRIQFQPPMDYGAKLAEQYPYPLPYIDYTGKDEHRNFLRKCQADFGWDWGPALRPTGIWRPIRLEAWSEARIVHVVCRQEHAVNGDVLLNIRVILDSPRGAQGRLEAHLGQDSMQQSVELSDGENTAELKFSISNPKRWWPNGYGEQMLYSLSVVFVGVKGEVDTHTERIGFRTVELMREPDARGESFYFKVNGVPVFAKGANWIPADGYPGRATHERLQDLLGSARGASMNMLRVWGGGVYESDDFYDLCDEYGFLIWQDFMFACALYPANDGFLREVDAEARYQIRRLASRACLALWCGNNENEQALLGAFWNKPEYKDEYAKDYRRLYLETLAHAVWEEDPSRVYWPSSPSNGFGIWGEPNELGRGDAHSWDVWSHGHEFSQYWNMHPRFVSEFGYQSAPSLASLQKVLAPEDLDFHGPMFMRRQRCGFGHRTLEKQMEAWFHPPRGFAETVYYTQVLQALSLKNAIEHWRRMRPECMGILYWQLNDIWPGMSWSSLEYDGSWKLLHHQLKTLYAPVMVSAGEAYGRVEGWVSNDTPVPLHGDVTVTLYAWSGEALRSWAFPAAVPGAGSVKCWDLPWPNLFPVECHRERFLHLRFTAPGINVSNVFFPAPFKETRIEPPQLQISEIEASGKTFAFEVASDKPAAYVYLTAENLAGRFSENGFFLLPERVKKVVFTPGETMSVQTFQDALRVRSIV
jgi:beta-mannosidase